MRRVVEDKRDDDAARILTWIGTSADNRPALLLQAAAETAPKFSMTECADR